MIDEFIAGRNKMEAKANAAEAALQHIFKNRQQSAGQPAPPQENAEDAGVDTEGDLNRIVPWQHVASFALFKLLNTWGDLTNTSGITKSGESVTGTPLQNRAAAKIPENAATLNPLMLMNQVLPSAQFEELDRSGTPPNIIFTFKCTVDKETFIGSGPAKKIAKKMAAFAACSKILKIQYPADVYSPVKTQVE